MGVGVAILPFVYDGQVRLCRPGQELDGGLGNLTASSNCAAVGALSVGFEVCWQLTQPKI